MPSLPATVLLIAFAIAFAQAKPASVEETPLWSAEDQVQAPISIGVLPVVPFQPTREEGSEGAQHTIKEILYDSHIYVGDPTMFLPLHPCDYLGCDSGKVCVVKPGYRRRKRKITCKPHCVSLAHAIRRPRITRECRYTPHPDIAGVEQLTCNCRSACDQEASGQRVCGSDGNTYRSYCHLQQKNCALKRNVAAVSIGNCPDKPDVVQARLCTPSLEAFSVNRDLPMYQPPIQYSYSFLLLACQAMLCPGAGPPVWYKQNVTDGVPGERFPYTFEPASSMVHSRPGSAYNVIFPSHARDGGLYTCEIHVGDKIFSSSKQVIVQRPASLADENIRQMEFEARLLRSLQGH